MAQPKTKQLPSVLLTSLKMEYEQTPITLEELATKHKINKEQLPTNWAKLTDYNQPIITIVPEQTSDGLPAPTSSEEDEDTKLNNEIRDELNKTAKAILKEAQSQLISGELAAKDLKDIASTLISIKESTLGKDPTVKIDVTNNTQVNLLNTIVNQIKGAERDC